MECQYCNSNFADLKLLTKHQKTKFCLKIQDKVNEIELLKKQLEEKDDEMKKQLEETDGNQIKEFDEIQNIIKEYCKK